MPVGSVTNTNGVDPSIAKVVNGSNSKMDQNTFLKLLVTQMTHQDPLNPQDQSQMLAQLAQFSQVESLNNVQDGQSKIQATALLGKTVAANIIQNNVPQYVKGVVTNVKFDSNGISLTVQGVNSPIQMSDITSVQN